jgi:hypothetical protein
MVRIQHPVFPRGPALYHLGRIIGEKPMGGGPAAAARRIAAVADSDILKRRPVAPRNVPPHAAFPEQETLLFTTAGGAYYIPRIAAVNTL